MAKKTPKKRGPKQKERLTPEMLEYVSKQILSFSERYRVLAALVRDLPGKEIHAFNWASLQIALGDVSAACAEAQKGYDEAVKNGLPQS